MELLRWLNQHFQESKRIRQQCDYFNAKIASWASIWSRGASWLDAPWPWKAAKKNQSAWEITKALGLFWEVRFDSRRAILMRYRLLRWLKALRWEKKSFLTLPCKDVRGLSRKHRLGFWWSDTSLVCEVQWSIANSRSLCHLLLVT